MLSRSILGFIAFLSLGIAGCSTTARSDQSRDNQLTEAEKQQGWMLLFDGKTTKGWRGYKQKECPQGWVVEDGCLFLKDKAGDLVTEETFSDFELQADWKIADGTNSGIMYLVSEDQPQPYMTGPEFQILDDPAFKQKPDSLTATGSLYALYAPINKLQHPNGEFNHTRIVHFRGHVEHWLNGKKTVDCQINSDEWKALVAKSKFKEWPKFGMNTSGHIDLQDEWTRVWYKNIKIRRLTAMPSP